MKPLLLTILVAFAIGLYPEYAHRIVNAVEGVVCSVFPSSDRSMVELIIVLVAIATVSQWKPNK